MDYEVDEQEYWDYDFFYKSYCCSFSAYSAKEYKDQ
jgi:hypothetical protein